MKERVIDQANQVVHEYAQQELCEAMEELKKAQESPNMTLIRKKEIISRINSIVSWIAGDECDADIFLFHMDDNGDIKRNLET